MRRTDAKADGLDIFDFEIDERGRAGIEDAIDAVCAELGVSGKADLRRQQVASGVVASWRHGRRLPLNLVSGGLDAAQA